MIPQEKSSGPSGAPRPQEITEMQYQVQRQDVARPHMI